MNPGTVAAAFVNRLLKSEGQEPSAGAQSLTRIGASLALRMAASLPTSHSNKVVALVEYRS